MERTGDAVDQYPRETSLRACREPMLASFSSGMSLSASAFFRCCSWRSVVRVTSNDKSTCGDTEEVRESTSKVHSNGWCLLALRDGCDGDALGTGSRQEGVAGECVRVVPTDIR